MAVNRDSNAYTVTFAVIMVIVVGTILTLIAVSLKSDQERNEEDKKRMDILAALNIEATRQNAAELYDQYIVDSKVLTFYGKDTMVVQGENDYLEAFEIDVKADYKDQSLTPTDKFYPLFVANVDGKTIRVVPMVGTGLWGPIWGYVSLKDDNVTVYGASFDHKTETPGLGAEIKETFFEEQWIGQQIFNVENGQYTSIQVKKGSVEADDRNAVMGITGGTITSNGVDEMAKRTFAVYRKYMAKDLEKAKTYSQESMAVAEK